MTREEISVIVPEDKPLVEPFIVRNWGSTTIISRTVAHDATTLPGFKAIRYDELIAMITYHIMDGDCEIVSLNSEEENQGVGTALVEKVLEKARELDCKRVWLVTSNDNIAAFRYYQIKGFDFVTVHRNALTEARKENTHIKEFGNEGIQIKHELELELLLK